MNEKPIGVIILTVLFLAIAGLLIYELFYLGSIGISLTICTVVYVGLCLLYILVAIGLFFEQDWAWTMGLVFTSLGLIWSLILVGGASFVIDLVKDAPIDLPPFFYVVTMVPLILTVLCLIMLLIERKKYR